MDKPLCALTMGDPAGVGPEVVLKTLFSQRARKAARMIVIGFPGPFVRDAELLGLDIGIRSIDTVSDAKEKDKTIDMIVPESLPDVPLVYGVMDGRCGKAAALCIERSAALAIDGSVDAVVTAPINKESLNAAGYVYPGHTEFYKHLTGADEIGMMLTLGGFRIIHVTTHTAIRNVPDLILKESIVRKALLLDEALRLLGIDRPKIAVSALNPHAGEAGMFGREEIEEIVPAVAELCSRDMDVTGPHPPDTVFAKAYGGDFDGVVAMYHDQGHIALKLAGFRFGESASEVAGVNTTLGLPIIRTSVDHGTAFDIAGKGVASPLSMIEAVEMAAALALGKKNRNT